MSMWEVMGYLRDGTVGPTVIVEAPTEKAAKVEARKAWYKLAEVRQWNVRRTKGPY